MVGIVEQSFFKHKSNEINLQDIRHIFEECKEITEEPIYVLVGRANIYQIPQHQRMPIENKINFQHKLNLSIKSSIFIEWK